MKLLHHSDVSSMFSGILFSFAAYLALLLVAPLVHKVPFWAELDIAAPMCPKTADTCNYVSEIIVYFLWQYSACLFVYHPVWSRPKITCHVYTIIAGTCIAGLAVFVQFSGAPDISLVFKSIFCLLVVSLAHCRLFSVISTAQYLASAMVLGHHLVLQRIYL